jgi:pyrroloquinoline quinone (PQQ) biosynthesis protein C
MKYENNGDNAWLHFGFAIQTTPDGVFQDNARDRCLYDKTLKKGMTTKGEIKADMWDTITGNMIALEIRAMKALEKKSGIIIRNEGHVSTGDLIGSCWVDLVKHPEVVEFIISHADDVNQNPSSGFHEILDLTEQEAMYEGMCDIVKQAMDVEFTFFDITKEEVEAYQEGGTEALLKVVKPYID